jgi:lipopolysaccharide biosynthesis regulator YciM
LAIYERSREWPQAAEVAALLERSGEVNFSVRQAHYLCEQAREAHARGDSAQAIRTLEEAMRLAPEAARSRILLGQLWLHQGQAQQAFQTLAPLFEKGDSSALLACSSLVKAAQGANQQEQARALLLQHHARQPGIDTLDALGQLEAEGSPQTRERYLQHLQSHPSLIAATRWLSAQDGRAALPAPVLKALEQAVRPIARYRCAACGFEAKEHFWHCPGCQAWDSYPPRRIEEL